MNDHEHHHHTGTDVCTACGGPNDRKEQGLDTCSACAVPAA